MIDSIHIFSKPLSNYNTTLIAPLISEQDVILLLGDACYDQKSYVSLSKHGYVLFSCLDMRNIQIHPAYSSISDTEWVNLIDRAKKSITW